MKIAYINWQKKLVFGHWTILPNLQDSNKIKHKLLSQPIQTNVCMDEPFSCNGGSNKEGPIEMCVYGVQKKAHEAEYKVI